MFVGYCLGEFWICFQKKSIMSQSIETLLPQDILDNLRLARQNHTLSYFADGTYTQDDVNGFISQVSRLESTITFSVAALILPTLEICM